MADTVTYVYSVVAAPRRPRIGARVRGLPFAGPTRLLDLDRGIWLVVADVPIARYSEGAIRKGLSNLDWVSRAAVAHEAVVESFINATAILPMKLFTMFAGDERALEHLRGDRARIDTLLKRVALHHEWGVRVVLDRGRAGQAPGDARKKSKQAARKGSGGHEYLARKKAQRDSTIELAARAQETVAALYDRLVAKARTGRRRTSNELPVQGGPLLLDAAFLVPRSRTAAFRALVGREARALERHGYGVSLSGPWPAYSFIQD